VVFQVEQSWQRIYAKTASLFELSALSAARISNDNAATVEKMRLYGYSIGMAFQIVDDVLDFTGEQATVGKPVASDLRQGLITLPALFYLENHPEDQEFKKVMAGSNSSEPLITQVISSIRESGAIERSLEEARKYIDRGLEALFSLPDSVYRQSLEQLASYIVARPL
jgi:geranylgeranyl pyrophosphate synthase